MDVHRICKTPATSDCVGPNACNDDMQIWQLLGSPLPLFTMYGKQRFDRTAADKCACPMIVQCIMLQSDNCIPA